MVVYLCDEEIVSANLGDSRAILCRGVKSVPITEDHKPDALFERQRIEEIGGVVKWHGFFGPDRLPVPGMGAYRVNGNLAVSRAWGDRLERPYVSSDPDIEVLQRNHEGDRFMVLASDGLWDVMTSQEVVDFVRQIMTGSIITGSSERSRKTFSNRMASVPPKPPSSSSSSKSDDIHREIEKRKSNMSHYLVDEAIRRGSADNVTAIVVWFK